MEARVARAVIQPSTRHEDETKTASSRKRVPLDSGVVSALQCWRAQSQFTAESDYLFASAVKKGKKPLSGNSAQRDKLRPASIRAGLAPIGWHALRHSYRTWLDEVGAPISVQRELMRHSTIAMTMDGYGRGVASANRAANSQVVSCCLTIREENRASRL